MFHDLTEKELRRRIRMWSERDSGPPSRGVYRERIAPNGEQWYKIVTSTGKVGIVHLPAELCDASLEENLWKRLDAMDKERHLKAI